LPSASLDLETQKPNSSLHAEAFSEGVPSRHISNTYKQCN
jgi:hypothetical protein